MEMFSKTALWAGAAHMDQSFRKYFGGPNGQAVSCIHLRDGCFRMIIATPAGGLDYAIKTLELSGVA
jgi:hypothetical protein